MAATVYHQLLLPTLPSAMSAKSLGTLPVIYAVDRLQNPLPRITMLFEDDMNSTGGRNDVFQST